MVYAVPREGTEDAASRAKISVIVPCYNAQRYLERCVNSIFSQTYGLENLEVILVNDASTDRTGDLMESYEKNHPEQVLVIHCEKNQKQGTARNIGMQYATGDYVTFVDADDAIAPGMLEELYRGITKWDTEIAECTQAEITGDHSIQSDEKAKEAMLYLIETEEERRAFFLSNAWACGPVRRLYRKAFLERNGIRFLENIYMEDMFFTYSVLSHCRSWYHIPDPLYDYYQNADSVMHSSSRKNYYMDVHLVFAKSLEKMQSENIFPILRNEMEYVYFKKVFYDLSSYILHTFQDPLQHGIEEMRLYIKRQFPKMWENPYMNEKDREDYDFLFRLEHAEK